MNTPIKTAGILLTLVIGLSVSTHAQWETKAQILPKPTRPPSAKSPNDYQLGGKLRLSFGMRGSTIQTPNYDATVQLKEIATGENDRQGVSFEIWAHSSKGAKAGYVKKQHPIPTIYKGGTARPTSAATDSCKYYGLYNYFASFRVFEKRPDNTWARAARYNFPRTFPKM